MQRTHFRLADQTSQALSAKSNSEVSVHERKERKLVIHDDVDQTDLESVFTGKRHVDETDLAAPEKIRLVVDECELEAMGIQDGDTVDIYDIEFEYQR